MKPLQKQTVRGGWASLKIQGAFFLASTPSQMEAGSEDTDVHQLEFVSLDGLDKTHTHTHKKTYLKQFTVVTTPYGYWGPATLYTHRSLQLTSELDSDLADQILFV